MLTNMPHYLLSNTQEKKKNTHVHEETDISPRDKIIFNSSKISKANTTYFEILLTTGQLLWIEDGFPLSRKHLS